MDKKKALGLLGFLATLIGFGATLASDYVKDQQLNDTIDEKVNEALAQRQIEEDDESEEEDCVEDVEEL